MSSPRVSSRAWRRPLVIGGPVGWLSLFLLVPILIIFAVSFMARGDYGELELPLTIENYKRLLGFGVFGFDSLYPIILLRSLLLGFLTVVFCVLAGMPLAFFIARLRPPYKNVALMLVVIPFWTNLLIRTYAWQILLAPESWITRTFHAVGIGEAGMPLYPGYFAVLIGMVCDFLPFFVLPLYASVEKIDWTLPEAAADLGANRWNVFRHSILPQIRPGLLAGMILVFLPATGQFVIPDLLGGAKTFMLGNAIQQQFGQSRDWPFGAAIAMIALLLVMICLWLYFRKAEQKGELL
ncbi:MAG: ABC transporter permease [Limisphaerales bacterium]